MPDAENTIVLQGTCRFCNQTQSVFDCHTEVDADEQATESCDCPGATRSRSEEETRAEMENRRENVLADARAKINEFFGAGAEERGEPRVDNELLEFMNKTAVLVYDEHIRQASFTISRGVKAVISKTNKKQFSVKRDDKNTREAVISD